MSRNRYGRIYHSDHSSINLRFKSLDARRVFEAKFNRYHADHDHDGQMPRFQEATAAEIGNPDTTTIHDVDTVTIDGYATYEIEEYHKEQEGTRLHRYQPPTCCVAPTISIKRKFVASDTLERHELSAIFTDMPDEDYQSLLESVKESGFIDDVIRLIDTEVLDGWHRYRAAKELNLLRKLRFQQWDEKKEGDPAAFVLGWNLYRRHQTASQRAQIVVHFNERFGKGNMKAQREGSEDSGVPNGTPKTRDELAKQAKVGRTTIDRAIQVEKEGESEAVRSGDKTAGEVLKARDAATAKKRKKQVLKNMWDARVQAARDYTGDSDTELNQFLSLPELEKAFAKNNESYALAFESGMKRIDAATSFQDFQERAFEVDEFGNAKVDTSEVEAEYKAIHTYAGDLRQWQRPDWSPDTNWILPLIEAKKKAKASKAEQELTEDRHRAKQAERKMWSALESVAPDWAKEDFAAAACDKLNWGVTEFPDPLETDIPAVWKARFDLLRNEINLPATWIQPMLTRMAETNPEPDTVDSLWEKITPAISVWKAARKGKGVGHASKTMFLNATKRFLDLPQERETDVELLKQLLDIVTERHGPGYTFERYIKMQCNGASIWEEADSTAETPAEACQHDDNTPADDTDDDTSLAEIDNLPAVKHFLEMLCKQVGTIQHPVDRDNVSVAIFDALVEAVEGLTDREQLSVLIECAHTLVNESL